MTISICQYIIISAYQYINISDCQCINISIYQYINILAYEYINISLRFNHPVVILAQPDHKAFGTQKSEPLPRRWRTFM